MLKTDELIGLVKQEMASGVEKFGVFATPHEGLAVLWEEFEELKQEVFMHHYSPRKGRDEAIQVAAVAIRFALQFGE